MPRSGERWKLSGGSFIRSNVTSLLSLPSAIPFFNAPIYLIACGPLFDWKTRKLPLRSSMTFHQQLKRLTASLRRERPQRGPAKDRRQAIDLILSHVDRHGPHLWGHVITLPQSVAGGVRLVARTNNDLESVFHSLKHGERRRSGRKTLTQDLEVLPPAAALATNLLHPDYVHLVCGSLEHLAEAFARLDVSDRSCSIAAGTPSNSTTVESASLSTIDKRLVRRPVFEDRVLAASQCV